LIDSTVINVEFLGLIAVFQKNFIEECLAGNTQCVL